MKSINLSPYFNALLLVTVFLLGIWAQSSGFVEQFIYYWDEIIYLSGHHIKLTLISGSIAILIGVPVGIILSRPACRKAADMVMQIFNIGTTVPTLAVLALSMSFLGIGDKPAIFALAFASVLPILAQYLHRLIVCACSPERGGDRYRPDANAAVGEG